MSSLFDIVPGYREAVDKEQESREVSFLSIPTEKVCGFECMAFTPYHYLLLSAGESSFIKGRIAEPSDIPMFLWVISPDYTLDLEKAKEHRVKISKKCRSLEYRESIQEIYSYIQDAFSDIPPTKSNTKEIPYTCWVANIVDMLAREYGWTEKTILHIPFKRLWQYAKLIKLHNNPKEILFNPSDKVKQEYINQLNK